MADLRRTVARRLRATLHGKEIDTFENSMPEIPQMLGIVPLGAVSTNEVETGTILDPNHEFWINYYKDVTTRDSVEAEIATAIQSLKDDDHLNVSSPKGENAGLIYVEAEIPDEDTDMKTTVCAKCGSEAQVEQKLVERYGEYHLVFDISCRDCGSTMKRGSKMTRIQ